MFFSLVPLNLQLHSLSDNHDGISQWVPWLNKHLSSLICCLMTYPLFFDFFPGRKPTITSFLSFIFTYLNDCNQAGFLQNFTPLQTFATGLMLCPLRHARGKSRSAIFPIDIPARLSFLISFLFSFVIFILVSFN